MNTCYRAWSYNDAALCHWGIKGMKWGVRRYQNKDGTLTPAGRKRYYKNDGTYTIEGKKKYVNDHFLKNRKELAELQKQHPGDIFEVDNDVVENIQKDIRRDKRLNNLRAAGGIAAASLGSVAVGVMLKNPAVSAVGGSMTISTIMNQRDNVNRYLDTYGEAMLDSLAIQGYKNLYDNQDVSKYYEKEWNDYLKYFVDKD